MEEKSNGGDRTEPDMLLLIYHEALDQGKRLDQFQEQMKQVQEQMRQIRADLNSTISAIRALGQRLGLLEESFTPIPTSSSFGGNDQ